MKEEDREKLGQCTMGSMLTREGSEAKSSKRAEKEQLRDSDL